MKRFVLISILAALSGFAFGQDAAQEMVATAAIMGPVNHFQSANLYVLAHYKPSPQAVKMLPSVDRSKATVGYLPKEAGVVTLDLGRRSVWRVAYASVSDFLEDATINGGYALVASFFDTQAGEIDFLFSNTAALNQQ